MTDTRKRTEFPADIFVAPEIECENPLDSESESIPYDLAGTRDISTSINNIAAEDETAYGVATRQEVAPESLIATLERRSKSEADIDAVYEEAKKLASENAHNLRVQNGFAWILYRRLHKTWEQLTLPDVKKSLKEYLDLKNPRPSMLHSQILNLALRIGRTVPEFKFIPFLKMWGPENFMFADFQNTGSGEKQYRPLYERAAERCFRLEASLPEVESVLATADPMGKSQLIRAFARISYFNMYENRDSGDVAVRTMLWKYVMAFQGHELKSRSHSRILRAAVWYARKDPKFDFKEFFEKWGLGNLREEDWERKPGNAKGETYPSLAEDATRAYLASVMDHGGMKQADDKIESILLWCIMHTDDDTMFVRRLSQYYYERGDVEMAMSHYKSLLARENKYYLWTEFSQMLQDPGLRKSALCKALSSQGAEHFFGKIHIELAGLLSSEGNWAMAASELKKVKTTYDIKKWHMPPKGEALIQMVAAHLGNAAPMACDYHAMSSAICDYVFENVPERKMALIEYFTDKKGNRRVKLSDGDKRTVVPLANFSPLFANATCGDIFLMRIDEHAMGPEAEAHLVPLTVKTADEERWSILPQLTGTVRSLNMVRSCYTIAVPEVGNVFFTFKQPEFAAGQNVRMHGYYRTYKGVRSFVPVRVVLAD